MDLGRIALRRQNLLDSGKSLYKKLQQNAEIARERVNKASEVSRKAMLRADNLAKAEEDRAKAAIAFLISLIFCTGVIGGFVVVGQMITDYDSCVLLSQCTSAEFEE